MGDQIHLARAGGAAEKLGRLAYIDWMRGLACVLMFQTHCHSAWLTPEARKTEFYRWSQAAGTFPAPLFVLLAGISSAMVTQRLREKGVVRNAIARTTILRGAEIFGLGLLFRVQEFILGYPKAPWTDLLRVDVLATPWLWTTYRPRWLPWPLESYVNGVHTYGQPQTWLFPIFPWVAFAFAGLALGFLLFSNFAKKKEGWFFAASGGAGVIACGLSLALDAAPARLYSVEIYDYWHTSPQFFLMRCGVLLVLLFLVYAWCRWGLAQKEFSPIIQLGNTSLLVYWVHIEFVYGRFSILPKGRCSALKATAGLVTIFLAMLALSVLRTNWKKWQVRASQ